MRLKLDENFGRRAAEILAAAGHDVATVVDEDLCRTSDGDIAWVCHAEGRCLVTLDLDFGNPLVFKPADYAGLVVVRLRGRVEPGGLQPARPRQCARTDRAMRPNPPARSTSMTMVLKRLVGWK